MIFRIEQLISFWIKKSVAYFWIWAWAKTVIALTAISEFLSSGYVNKVLIIAPLRVVNTVWKQEASKWDHLKHLNIVLCSGGVAKNRTKTLENTKADIVVIKSRECLLVS